MTMQPIAGFGSDGSFLPWGDIVGYAVGSLILLLGLYCWRYSERLWKPLGAKVHLFGVTFPPFGAFIILMGIALYYIHFSNFYLGGLAMDDYRTDWTFSRLHRLY
jgi:hypothetical protein